MSSVSKQSKINKAQDRVDRFKLHMEQVKELEKAIANSPQFRNWLVKGHTE